MRKKLTAIVLAVLVFSLIAASAASLGGINTADIGAEVDTVASCELDAANTSPGVDVDFTTGFSGGEYVVTAVTVSDIYAGCAGQNLSVTLSGTTGADLPLGPVAIGGASATIAVANYSANDLDGVAVLIAG